MANRESIRFTETEATYLAENRLGRLATVGRGGPHVVPVAYEFDGTYVYFGGWNMERSLKFKNIMSNAEVAFVVDDVKSARPWRPRGIEIRGRAEVVSEDGHLYVKIVPVNKSSWGLREPTGNPKEEAANGNAVGVAQ